jgi:hypothetical protein
VCPEPLDDLLRRQRVILHDSPQPLDLGAEFVTLILKSQDAALIRG